MGAISQRSNPQAEQQSLRFAKPRTLTAALVRRHGGTLFENLLRPLPGLIVPPLRLQELRIVVIGFGHGGNLDRLLKHGAGFFGLSGLRVGVSEQAFGAMKS